MSARQDKIFELFDEQWAEDGKVENYDGIEDSISEGSDDGCYVLAWVWVSFEGEDMPEEEEES